MTALIALILCGAPPISEELAGAPEPTLRLAGDVPRGVVPPKWYLEDDGLQSADASETLFDASKGGPHGPVVGTACQLTSPDTFHLSHITLTPKEAPWRVYSGTETAYLPIVLRAPPRLAIWRDETHDKDVVGEIVFGFISAGISLLRLTPTYITTVSPPPRGKARSGNFSAECRAVGQDTVDAVVAAAQQKRTSVCDALSCLRDDVALLGPDHPSVVERAQAIVDAGAREAAQWRSLAKWKHRSYEVLDVTHCGPTCVKVTIKNTAVVPHPPPHFDDGLDALGRPVELLVDFSDRIAPGKTRVLRLTVSLDFRHERPATFPVVLRSRDDFWSHPVPGTFTEDQVEYDFQPTGTCDGDYATAQIRAHKLGDPRKEPDVAWLSNGDDSHLVMPFPSWGKPWVDGEARAYAGGGKTCPHITAISGRLTDWHSVLLP